MKRITVFAITLVMLAAMSSCNGDMIEPANTTVGTTATEVTTGSTTVTTVGEGLAPAVTETTEVTETAAPVTEEPFDAEAFLAECTVYEVTVDTQDSPLNELDKLEDADKPEKIALRFTDAEGLTILMKIGADGFYYDKHFFNNNISVSVEEDQFAYGQRGFFVEYNNGITVVQEGENPFVKYHIFKGTDYEVVENVSNESGYVLDVYIGDDSTLKYKKTNWNYYYAKQSISVLTDTYVSDDDFYCENGTIVFENGEIEFVKQSSMTVGEWYQSDSFVYKTYRDKYNTKTFSELMDLYKKFVSEGRESEFY